MNTVKPVNQIQFKGASKEGDYTEGSFVKPSQPGPVKYIQLANGEIMACPLQLYYHNQIMSTSYSNLGQSQTVQYGNDDDSSGR